MHDAARHVRTHGMPAAIVASSAKIVAARTVRRGTTDAPSDTAPGCERSEAARISDYSASNIQYAIATGVNPLANRHAHSTTNHASDAATVGVSAGSVRAGHREIRARICRLFAVLEPTLDERDVVEGHAAIRRRPAERREAGRLERGHRRGKRRGEMRRHIGEREPLIAGGSVLKCSAWWRRPSLHSSARFEPRRAHPAGRCLLAYSTRAPPRVPGRTPCPENNTRRRVGDRSARGCRRVRHVRARRPQRRTSQFRRRRATPLEPCDRPTLPRSRRSSCSWSPSRRRTWRRRR